MSIQKLIEEAVKVGGSPRQCELRGLWERHFSSKEFNWIPIFVAFSRTYWARLLNYNLIEYYTAEKQLEAQLKKLIFMDRNIGDDTLIGGGSSIYTYAEIKSDLYVDFGGNLEPSLFGIENIFSPDSAPWIGGPMRGGEPLVKNEEDIGALNFPDFYKDGLMPRVHEMYETFNRILGGRLSVCFPTFNVGPWGVATYLMGIHNLHSSLIRNPELVHKLMHFVTESRIRYERDRAKYLGTRIPRAFFWNDEVDGNLMSLKTYENFIFPYEERLAKFYSGIAYYHSCGNLTPLVGAIKKLPISVLDTGPWTDLEVMKAEIGKELILQKRVNPTKDLLLQSSQGIRSKIEEILKIGKGIRLEIATTNIDQIGGHWKEPVRKTKLWLNLVKELRKRYKRNGKTA